MADTRKLRELVRFLISDNRTLFGTHLHEYAAELRALLDAIDVRARPLHPVRRHEIASEQTDDLVTHASEAAPKQKRDDTGRLTSDYEPTPHEIKVAREAICREFGNNGTDGYYVRILKAIHGAAPVAVGDASTTLIALLRELRPVFGAAGSRDVDVRDQQRRFDAALAILASQAVPDTSSSQPMDDNCGATRHSWTVSGMKRDPEGSWVLASCAAPDAAKGEST